MSDIGNKGNDCRSMVGCPLSAAVAMATYNGRRFIEEQMESIRTQSLPARRVIIRDDGSSDGTQSVVREYIARHGLDSWDFAENEANKGFTANFLDAALEANEDVVFFSDQDDIWLESKMANAMGVFAEYEGCIAVLCAALVVNEHGVQAETAQTRHRRKTLRKGEVSFAEQVSSMVASGHTLCVKRDFLEEVAPIIKSQGLTYDSPLGIMAAARRGLFGTGTVDVLHRVHSNNTSTPTYALRQRMGDKTRHIAGRRFQLDVLEKCREQVRGHCDGQTLALYDREIEARQRSLTALEMGTLFPLVASIFRHSPMKNEAVEVANLAIGLFGRG